MISSVDMKNLSEMIKQIKTNAEASRVYKEKCVELSDYVDNLSDSFHLIQSSETLLADSGVQRALIVLREALQKTALLMENCGKPVTASAVFAKGVTAIKELEDEIQKGISLLGLALNVHNSRKLQTAQFLDAPSPGSTSIPCKDSTPNSSISASENASAGSSSRILGESSKSTMAEPPSTLGNSSQNATARPYCGPCESSHGVMAETSCTLGKGSQSSVAGSSIFDKSSQSMLGGPSGNLDNSAQKKKMVEPSGKLGESSQSALAEPSRELVESSKTMSTGTSLILGSAPTVSTSLSTSTPPSHQISAKSFDIVWGDDRRYWQTITSKGSMFDEVMYLNNVCWLEVNVKYDNNTLKPGTYTLTWRYNVACSDDCWERSQVTFKMSELEGRNLLQRSMYLCPKVASRYNDDVTFTVCTNEDEEVRLCSKDSSLRNQGIWIEYPVFNFTVEEGHNPQMVFSLIELGGHWKRGLALDAVLITPSV